MSRWTSPRRWVIFAIVAGGAAVPFACSNDVGDQVCTAAINLDDTTDDCPYGPPGGPKVDEPPCETKALDPSSKACEDDAGMPLVWEKVYVDLQDSNLGGVACYSGGCHGQPATSAGVELDNPYVLDGKGLPTKNLDHLKIAGAYNELKTYTGGHDDSYIDSQNPTKSWIVCNLDQRIGGGKVMPPLPQAPMDPHQFALDQLERWVGCGAIGSPPP